ncbi:MAG: hypothetical protein J4N89_00110 [Chloroflexi bacterium]|nr:hypothetical protein [Chloroflexota bacterium]MCI0864915.1 hypothetical protein [Chloroflexota bacterium]MCI0894075.1 hypothetical protein [Chloroflexota bacterium]
MATTQTTVEHYNYAGFQGGESDFMAFRTKLPVGSAAPDIAATLLDTGQPVQLSDYWRNGDLVVEFGSLT